MRLQFIRANYFEGDEQLVEDTPINGTLEGDCTGIINFPSLGGIQPYAYYPENCSVVMSTTGNVFQNRNDRCPGNFFQLKTFQIIQIKNTSLKVETNPNI